jgi:hypothetical protein
MLGIRRRMRAKAAIHEGDMVATAKANRDEIANLAARSI